MTRIIITTLLLALVTIGEVAAGEQQKGNALNKFLDSYEERYLINALTATEPKNSLPVKEEGVIWLGQKNGLQPPSPYTCVAFYKHKGGGQVLVVEDDDYKEILKLWSSITLNETVVKGGFRYRMITFSNYMKTQHSLRFAKSWTPSMDSLVCIRELHPNSNEANKRK